MGFQWNNEGNEGFELNCKLGAATNEGAVRFMVVTVFNA